MIDILAKIKQEEDLLNDWANNIPGFIRDGVVNPEQYYNQPFKIMVLLKEVNGGADWDLREFLRTGGREQTWNNVARWIEGILNIEQELPWTLLEDNNEARRKEMLNKICAVNVKKISGTYVADNKIIKNFAKTNSEYLKKQVEIYSPDLIICGGTEASYFQSMTPLTKPVWKMTTRGIWYVKEPNGRIVISYSHPEARVKDCVLYYGLIDAVREILKK